MDASKVNDDTLLFSSGLVDSFAMVELVVFVESTCGFKLKPSEVSLDNLDSINRLLAFVAKKYPAEAVSAGAT